ncbi:hypothetical protein HDV00_009748 [Rhizophlyctis rosea]|nr:hypothetical protein HDV00_009748 [Rhizophlyctis rosea]
MSTSSSALQVAIIGGGIGGLALGHALRNTPNVHVTIYERDTAPAAREQGYQIGINPDGLKALLSACPDLDTGKVFDTKYMTTGVNITDASLRTLLGFEFPKPKEGSGVPAVGTVSRVMLRHAMASLLLQNTNGNGTKAGIYFGKKVVSYHEENSKVIAVFDDNTDTGPIDILVGADGSRSHIRTLLFPTLQYNPINILNTGIAIPLSTLPTTSKIRAAVIKPDGSANLARAVSKRGSSILFLVCHNMSSGIDEMALAVTKRMTEEEMEAFNSGMRERQTDDAKAGLMRDTCLRIVEEGGFDKEIVNVIAGLTTEQCLVHIPMQISSVTIPSGFVADLGPTRVVLLGDAAHATTTHAGLGANTALQDAVDLAAVIKAASSPTAAKPVPEIMKNYHVAMFERAKKVIKTSTNSSNMITMGGAGAYVRDGFMLLGDGLMWTWKTITGK